MNTLFHLRKLSNLSFEFEDGEFRKSHEKNRFHAVALEVEPGYRTITAAEDSRRLQYRIWLPYQTYLMVFQETPKGFRFCFLSSSLTNTPLESVREPTLAFQNSSEFFIEGNDDCDFGCVCLGDLADNLVFDSIGEGIRGVMGIWWNTTFIYEPNMSLNRANKRIDDSFWRDHSKPYEVVENRFSAKLILIKHLKALKFAEPKKFKRKKFK